jgi:hypothetical protein
VLLADEVQDIVMELRMTLLKITVRLPLSDLVKYSALAEGKSIDAVRAAQLLSWPGNGRIVEVNDGAWQAVGRVDKVTEVDIRVGLHDLSDVVRARRDTVDSLEKLKVIESIVRNLCVKRLFRVAED